MIWMDPLNKNKFRFYYWLLAEFVKKHTRLILLSFFLSFISIVTFISLSPYITNTFLSRKQTIGVVGNYDYNNLPEEITGKISNGLIFINQKGEYTPALASSWEVGGQGKEYRFHFRDNLLWSDGKKFKASDLKYNFKDVTTKIIDDKTVTFELQKPLPIFPVYLKNPVLKYPLIGIAGLYKIDRIKSKYGYIKELILSPNKKDLPSIIYKFYDNESSQVTAYKQGEINEFATSKKSVADLFKSWKNSSVVVGVDYNHLMTLFYNFDNQIIRDKDVRQAIAMATDVSKFRDSGEVALGPIPPNSWGYNENLKRYSFDPDAARKILENAQDSSKSAALNFVTYYDYLDIADTLNESFKEVGLKTNLLSASSDKPDNFDLFLALWKVPTDPDQYYFWHSTQVEGNIGSYKNDKIDKLLEDGRSKFSPTDRRQVYLDYQKVIVDNPPAFFLYYPYTYTVKRK